MLRFSRISGGVRYLYEFLINYPAALNYTYLWNFGFYAMLCLVIQITSGIFLSMHYIADSALAFDSVEHIMRDVNSGWLLRYIHANGASFFFIAVYTHVFRGIYYFSYVKPREFLWCIGVVILLLMIITAFLGYVLPWGQMSFWGATVITNILSIIPKVGTDLVVWVWGGYAISKATLVRFFSFHFLFPFIIFALVIVHFIILHEVGGNNPLGIEFKGYDNLTFFPFYIIKDVFGIIIFLSFFFFFVFFFPNFLGHSDNYILANPLVTPAHIVPEWYLLPFYAILRAIPDKFFGALALVAAILVLMVIPFYSWSPYVKSLNFRFFSRFFFFFLLIDTFLLGWLGSCPAEYPYVQVSQITSFFYFFFWLILLPFLSLLENFIFLNTSTTSRAIRLSIKREISVSVSKCFFFFFLVYDFFIPVKKEFTPFDNLIELSIFNSYIELLSYVCSFFNYFFDDTSTMDLSISPGLIDQSDFFIKEYYYATKQQDSQFVEDVSLNEEAYFDRVLDSIFLLKDSVLYNENFFFLELDPSIFIQISNFVPFFVVLYVISFIFFLFFLFEYKHNFFESAVHKQWYTLLSFFLILDFSYIFVILIYSLFFFLNFIGGVDFLLSLSTIQLNSYFSDFLNLNVYSNYLLVDTFFQNGNNPEFVSSLLSQSYLFLGTYPSWFFFIFMCLIPLNVFLMFYEGSDDIYFDLVAFVYFLSLFLFLFSISFVRFYAVFAGFFSNLIMGEYGHQSEEHHIIYKYDVDIGSRGGVGNWLNRRNDISDPNTDYPEGVWLRSQFMYTFRAFYRDQLSFVDLIKRFTVDVFFNFLIVFYRVFLFMFSFFGVSSEKMQIPTFYLHVMHNPANYSSVSSLRIPFFEGETKPLSMLNRMPHLFTEEQIAYYMSIKRRKGRKRTPVKTLTNYKRLAKKRGFYFVSSQNLEYPGVPYSHGSGKWFFDKGVYQSFFGKELLVFKEANFFRSYYTQNMFKKRVLIALNKARITYMDVLNCNKKLTKRYAVTRFIKNWKGSDLLVNRLEYPLYFQWGRYPSGFVARKNRFAFYIKRSLDVTTSFPRGRTRKRVSGYLLKRDFSNLVKARMNMYLNFRSWKRKHRILRVHFEKMYIGSYSRRIRVLWELNNGRKKKLVVDPFLNKKYRKFLFFNLTKQNESFLFLSRYLKNKGNDLKQVEVLAKNNFVLLKNELRNIAFDSFVSYRLKSYASLFSDPRRYRNPWFRYRTYTQKDFFKAGSNLTRFGFNQNFHLVNNLYAETLNSFRKTGIFPHKRYNERYKDFSLRKFKNNNFFFSDINFKDEIRFSRDSETIFSSENLYRKKKKSENVEDVLHVKDNRRFILQWEVPNLFVQFLFKTRPHREYFINFLNMKSFWLYRHVNLMRENWSGVFNDEYTFFTYFRQNMFNNNFIDKDFWENFRALRYPLADAFVFRDKSRFNLKNLVLLPNRLTARARRRARGESRFMSYEAVRFTDDMPDVLNKAYNSALLKMSSVSERVFSDSIKYELTALEDFNLYEANKYKDAFFGHSNFRRFSLFTTKSGFKHKEEHTKVKTTYNYRALLNFKTFSFGAVDLSYNGFANLLFPGYYRYGRSFDFSLVKDQLYNKLFLERTVSENFLKNFNKYLSSYTVDYEMQEHIKERSQIKDDFLYDNVQESFLFFSNCIKSKRDITEQIDLNYVILNLRDDFLKDAIDSAYNEYLLELQCQLKGRGLLLDEANWYFFKSI